MVRRWLVRPDQVVQTEAYGEIPCVSREAMVAAMLDGEAALARFGGHISVSTTRHPTDFPGEMVTTAAAFIWKDRTDAKEQPEPQRTTGGTIAYGVAALPEPEAHIDDFVPGEEEQELADEINEAALAAVAEGAALPRDSIGDGLDESTLEDEDLSAVPEHAR